MNQRIPRALLLSLVLTIFAVGVTSNAVAQSTDPNWRPVVLKFPVGYLPAEFPEKRAGKLMLNKDKPAGMFIVYPKAGEGFDVLHTLLKTMTVGMFLHDTKATITWTETTLPVHKGVENETGVLYSASNEEKELQLAVYTRKMGGTTVLYGYYAGRDKGKKDAPFLDGSGKGVEDLDKLSKSIHLSEK